MAAVSRPGIITPASENDGAPAGRPNRLECHVHDSLDAAGIHASEADTDGRTFIQEIDKARGRAPNGVQTGPITGNVHPRFPVARARHNVRAVPEKDGRGMAVKRVEVA